MKFDKELYKNKFLTELSEIIPNISNYVVDFSVAHNPQQKFIEVNFILFSRMEIDKNERDNMISILKNSKEIIKYKIDFYKSSDRTTEISKRYEVI